MVDIHIASRSCVSLRRIHDGECSNLYNAVLRAKDAARRCNELEVTVLNIFGWNVEVECVGCEFWTEDDILWN